MHDDLPSIAPPVANTFLAIDEAGRLLDRYSERQASAEELSRRVNLRTI